MTVHLTGMKYVGQFDGRHCNRVGARHMFALWPREAPASIREHLPLFMRSLSSLLLLLLLAALLPSSVPANAADAGFDPALLGRSIVYPVRAVLSGQEGSVLMRVLVQPDGSVERIEWRQG